MAEARSADPNLRGMTTVFLGSTTFDGCKAAEQLSAELDSWADQDLMLYSFGEAILLIASSRSVPTLASRPKARNAIFLIGGTEYGVKLG